MLYNLRTLKILNAILAKPVCRCMGLFDRKLPKAPKKANTVLVLKLGEAGSIIESIPAIQELRNKLGERNVYFFTLSSTGEILRNITLIKESNIFFLNDTSVFSLLKSFPAVISEIRKTRIDVVLDFEGLSTFSTIILRLLNCPVKIGFCPDSGYSWRRNALTVRIPCVQKMHISRQFMSLVKPMIETDKSEALFSEIPSIPVKLDTSALNEAKNKFNEQAAFILINPNSNDLLHLRRWPADSYSQLTKKLLTKTDLNVIFIGRADELSQAENLVYEISKTYPGRIISLAGKTTLASLFALLRETSLLITSDCGTAHFASLFKTKSVVLFGPETPLCYAPLNPRAVCITAGLACSPCFNIYNNRLSSCRDNRCLKNIEPDEVFKVSVELLNK